MRLQAAPARTGPRIPAQRPDAQPLERARDVCIAAQGLPRSPDATLGSVLERNGFVRTLGGSDAYLALLCRVPGLTRDLAAISFRGGTPAVTLFAVDPENVIESGSSC